LAAAGQAIGGAIGTWGGRVVGGAIGTVIEPGGGTAAGAAIGGAVGGRVGGAIGSAVQDICTGGPRCDELEKNVRDAKDNMGRQYQRGEAVCQPGMSRAELARRAADWLNLAKARAQRDQVCFSGGDANHQQEQATAWNQVSKCQNLMK
jgi:type VI secretion system secreted protein VgrG